MSILTGQVNHMRETACLTPDNVAREMRYAADTIEWLRNLILDMRICICRDCKCEGCPLYGDKRCYFDGRMQVLGIEVES